MCLQICCYIPSAPKGLRPQGVAPHPISFFLKKKETKKITFADGIPKGRSVPDGTRFEREAGRNPFGQGFGG
jgi:hypothetical protein